MVVCSRASDMFCFPFPPRRPMSHSQHIVPFVWISHPLITFHLQNTSLRNTTSYHYQCASYHIWLRFVLWSAICLFWTGKHSIFSFPTNHRYKAALSEPNSHYISYQLLSPIPKDVFFRKFRRWHEHKIRFGHVFYVAKRRMTRNSNSHQKFSFAKKMVIFGYNFWASQPPKHVFSQKKQFG